MSNAHKIINKKTVGKHKSDEGVNWKPVKLEDDEGHYPSAKSHQPKKGRGRLAGREEMASAAEQEPTRPFAAEVAPTGVAEQGDQAGNAPGHAPAPQQQGSSR